MIELDEALARFQLGGLEYGIGLANHGPMAAEALVALGHPALIESFVDVYAPRLPAFEADEALSVDRDTQGLEKTLGRPELAARWVATFERELARMPWDDVLREWLPLLQPGLFAAAGHGLLRTAHAVRALENTTTPVRTRELAFGLAHWAARFQRLPTSPGGARRAGLSAAKVLAKVVPVPVRERSPGLFMDAVRILDRRPDHAECLATFDPLCEAPEAALAGLCREAGRLYLENPIARIAYVHTLTLPIAMRSLLPYCNAETSRRAVKSVVAAVSALHAVSAAPAAPGAPAARAGDPAGGARDAIVEDHGLCDDRPELRYRAACSLEEHAIKLVEACLREDALEDSRVLRQAAADGALGLGAR